MFTPDHNLNVRAAKVFCCSRSTHNPVITMPKGALMSSRFLSSSMSQLVFATEFQLLICSLQLQVIKHPLRVCVCVSKGSGKEREGAMA